MKFPRFKFPSVRVQPAGHTVTLNTEAFKLLVDGLSADDDIYIAIIKDSKGLVSFKTLQLPPDTVAVSLIHPPGPTGWVSKINTLVMNNGLYQRGKRYRARWNDIDEQLDIMPEVLEDHATGDK